MTAKPRYAASTDTPASKTKREIEDAIIRAGGDLVSFGWAAESVERIGFRLAGRFIQWDIPHPPAVPETLDQVRRDRAAAKSVTPKSIADAVRMEVDRRWRVARLAIIVRLELMAEAGETPEQAFTAHLVLPSGETLGERLAPEIERMYATGEPPRLTLGTPKVAALPEGTR